MKQVVGLGLQAGLLVSGEREVLTTALPHAQGGGIVNRLAGSAHRNISSLAVRSRSYGGTRLLSESRAKAMAESRVRRRREPLS
jgi:hypothetical protein